MLKMAQQQYIKYLYEKEEKSLAEIARTTNLNYRTVRKYALKDDWNEDKLPNLEPESYPVLGEFIPTINEWLEKDKLVPRKQRHTGKRIYYRLCDEAAQEIRDGDTVAVDFNTGLITDETTGKTYQAEPFPEFIQNIIAKGGLIHSIL